MITVSRDCGCVIFIEYLPKRETINADRYVGSLNDLHEELKKKRPGKPHRRVLLQHDNARPYVVITTLAEIWEKNWELLPHPPYNPDLAPCDYHLFGLTKQAL